jgi:hypothetical protein
MTIPRDDLLKLASLLDRCAIGEDNTRPLRVLSRYLRWNERYLQRVGQALARAGYPLGTSCSPTRPGWFKATDPARWAENIARRKHRRDQESITIAAAEKALRFVGTGRLFDLEEAEMVEAGS